MTRNLRPASGLPDTPFVRVVLAQIEGSSPREAGAWMLVKAGESIGTIGGGQLEHEAIAHARAMLNTKVTGSWERDMRTWPLGPSLGQCCGGTVRVLFERCTREERVDFEQAQVAVGGLIIHPLRSGEPLIFLSGRQDARALPLPVARIAADMLSGAGVVKMLLIPGRAGDGGYLIEPHVASPVPLFIFGAGHVGRAIVKIVADLDFDIHWVDTHEGRFPDVVPANVTKICARQPERIATAAPAGAFHLVLTYSHAIDMAVCQSLLSVGVFGFLGLIGSKTKKARFLSRLGASGIASDALTRLTCPIGIGTMRGKEPVTIAVGVAAQLIDEREHMRERTGRHYTGNQKEDNGTDKQISA